MLETTSINVQNKIKFVQNIKPKINCVGKIKPHLYNINFPSDEENLCKMEMKYLFSKVPNTKSFFTYHYVDPTRSPFIKYCISIIYSGNTLEDILNQISNDNLSFDRFKVSFINNEDESLGYHERRKIEYLVGQYINGEAELKYPEILLGITRVNKKWLFGVYKMNKASWKLHNRKPYYYSNALDVRIARALVNIAVSNDFNCSVIDPCCGIGTVVMEALSLGINVKGYEINPLIAENAIKNLEYFGYRNVIATGDMHTITNNFDVSIVDIPYGLFSPTTLTEQVNIIKTARRISKKMIIITFEDMDRHILSAGFKIIDRCHVSKGKFKRYITICK